MSSCTPKIFVRYLFSRNSFHDIGTRDVHLPDAFNHVDEVSEGGRVDRTTSGRTSNDRDLRNDTRSECVPTEDFTVAGKGVDAFLDSGSTGVVYTNDWSTDLHGVIHHLGNLLRRDLRQRTTKYGEVLSVGEYLATVYKAVSGYDSVAFELLLVESEVR